MSSDITSKLRQFVLKRADHHCEYCGFPAAFAIHQHEADHIIPVQHGGETSKENLACSCMRCNRYKGPNVGSFDPVTGVLTPFFNPRIHKWQEHFQLDGATIQPLTPIARVNEPERVTERQHLIDIGLY